MSVRKTERIGQPTELSWCSVGWVPPLVWVWRWSFRPPRLRRVYHPTRGMGAEGAAKTVYLCRSHRSLTRPRRSNVENAFARASGFDWSIIVTLLPK